MSPQIVCTNRLDDPSYDEVKQLGRKVRDLSRYSQDRVADLGAVVTESFAATQTIQSFNHEAEDRRFFGTVVEQAFQTAFSRIKMRAILTFIVIVMAILWHHTLVVKRIVL